ncbi:alpha/beta fold hydrolase [Nocardiopsis sp. MG754419]|uniref:alpha/beta fold hydrolase n=1 Tax=Nocardiopsis sp. MG754419 TaxID=2259865 RepID=UPI001BA93F87|nr:alpha/beta fold hydrolase [Nocardiopsis sp. MG754419]MBR8744490.1 hypothetical protein [Nocardiopsis sp. MG754419]
MRCVPALASTSVALALTLTGCTADAPVAEADTATEEERAPDLSRFQGGLSTWDACLEEEHGDDLLAWGADEEWSHARECSVMTVPRDDTDPERADVEMFVIRRPAEGTPEEYRGSLVLNPGGPGVSGVDMLTWETFTPDIRAAYDLVSFDPRGVGASAPLPCEGEQDEVAETAWEKALGWDSHPDDELRFVGHSYGTHLGALYAALFPEHVGAMVLDGGVDGALDLPRMAVEQTASFQNTWERFVADCACPWTARSTNCAPTRRPWTENR